MEAQCCASSGWWLKQCRVRSENGRYTPMYGSLNGENDIYIYILYIWYIYIIYIYMYVYIYVCIYIYVNPMTWKMQIANFRSIHELLWNICNRVAPARFRSLINDSHKGEEIHHVTFIFSQFNPIDPCTAPHDVHLLRLRTSRKYVGQVWSKPFSFYFRLKVQFPSSRI